jgi:hypothetical protein
MSTEKMARAALVEPADGEPVWRHALRLYLRENPAEALADVAAIIEGIIEDCEIAGRRSLGTALDDAWSGCRSAALMVRLS